MSYKQLPTFHDLFWDDPRELILESDNDMVV